MFSHIRLGEFYTNGKNPDGEHDAREFQSDGIRHLLRVCSAPRTGVEDVGTIRAFCG